MSSKKWLSLFTAMILVFQSTAVMTWADEPAVSPLDSGSAAAYEAAETEMGSSSVANAKAAAASGTYITDSYVNPLYEGMTIGGLSDDTAESGFRLMTEEADVVFHDTIEEAAEVLLNGMKAREETITVGVTAELYDELEAITSAHKEIFFESYEYDPADPTGGDYIRFTFGGWNGAGIKGDDGWTLSYYFEYYTTLAEEAEVDAKVEELTAEWKAMDMTDYQIVRTIYEYITENVTYDDAGLTAYNNAVSSDTLTMNHCKIFTAYKALIDGTAVCQGYANLFYRLALEMGVDARIIASVRLEKHAWNIVKLGRWYYNMDATWDAENVETGYQWFLLNEAEFSTEHTRRDEFDTEAFHEAHPMGPESYAGVSETMTGICGEDLRWTLTPAGELSITGTGDMYDYVPAGKDGECAPWMPWKTAITRLTIGAETGSVGAAAFSGMRELTEVVIPDSVQKIGALAFADCDGIAALTLGDGVRTIASGAFANCGGLITVTLPASASVEDAPFYGCDALAEILLADGNEMLAVDDAGVLMDAAYTHVYQVPAAAAPEHYTVPDTVTGIGAGAFAYCTDLKSVRFSGAVPEIHASAFYGTSADLQLYYPAYAAGWEEPTMTFSGMDVYGNVLSVTVNTQSYPVKGDISCDSRVTAADAKLFAQYFAGYPVTINIPAADIDGENGVTRKDVMILKRYIAGWEGYDEYFAE